MRIGKLKKQLNLWEKNNLISSEQNKNIEAFMKERQKENFFRLIKFVSVIGALWIIFGFIITVINFFQLDFMAKIAEFIAQTYIAFMEFLDMYIFSPVYNFLYGIYGNNYVYFVWGVISVISFLLFHFLSKHYKANPKTNSLNLSEEQKYILKTNYMLDVFAAVSLAAAFCLFNMLLIPNDKYYSEDKIIPIINILGAVTFITLAYKCQKVLYLLFGIYFIALSAGLFAGYGYACYWIGCSRPIVQILISLILLLLGYISEYMSEKEDSFIKEKFSQIYNWTGLFMLFIALWIVSFWGFDLNIHSPHATDIELWIGNILFIAAALGAMYYGAKNEHNVFFNYGLTFLFIETYTVFCSRLWSVMPVGLASLIFGGLMLYTVKVIKQVYLEQKKN
ncbi:hypothetical protein IKQ26_07080 [bacterium]|nr:hypothetical protein [bacterium]